jgi:hypothetical protein
MCGAGLAFSTNGSSPRIRTNGPTSACTDAQGEAIRPARSRLATQQRAFNGFRDEYNHERPHQSLRGRTPGSLYQPSARTYTGELPPFEYPGHFILKRVTNAGTFRFKKRVLFIANGLIHHTVGLEEIHDGIWSIYFCRVLIG